MNRALGWWVFAEEVVRRIASPRADVSASDRRLELLARESRLAAGWRALVQPFRAAWSNAFIVVLVRIKLQSAVPSDRTGRIRLVGLVGTTAFATSLLVGLAGSERPDPLSWVLPTVGVAVGVLIFCAAGPLARASEHRRT